jgi:O-antigen/teichoic acid export membrane protein
MITTVLGTIFTLYPAWRHWPVEFIVALQAVNTAVRFLLSEWLYRKLFAGTPRAPFPGGIRAQLGYVVPLAITRFASIFNQRLDKFVVGLFFAASAFADFERGSQELPLVTLLPYTMASMMLPDLVGLVEKGPTREEGARAALELWKAGIRKASLVMLPIAAVLLVLAEPLMVTLYGQQYLPAAAPFRVYSSLLPLRVTSYGIMLMAYGQTTKILRVQVLGMAFNVAASFVLLPRIGMIGAPLAAVLTQVFMIVYILRRVDIVARVGLRGIFPWGHYGRVAFASIVGVAPVLLAVVLHAPVHAAVLLAVGIPLTFAIYLPLARALGTLTAEDREYVARWMRLEPLRKKPKDEPPKGDPPKGDPPKDDGPPSAPEL